MQRDLRLWLLVNVITAVAGVPLYPFVAVLLYPVFVPRVSPVFGYSMMVGMGVLSFGFGVMDAELEPLLLRYLFKVRMTPGQRLPFLVANLLSAGLLFGAIYRSETPVTIVRRAIPIGAAGAWRRNRGSGRVAGRGAGSIYL